MRLIDADALMRKLTVSPCGTRYREYNCDNFPATLTLIEVKKMVRNEPTVAKDNNVPTKQPDPITGLVPCEYCKNPKKLMEDGYYQVTPNTKWLPDIGDLVCTTSGEYAIFAIDGCEDDTFLCQGMTTCPMCGRKLTAPPRPGAKEQSHES